MRRALLLACAVLALAPAVAAAWRHPTSAERRAIVRAAQKVPHTPASARVHVGQIRISRVGPWASAGVMIRVGGAPDTATDILRRRHGRWRSVSVGTAGEECVMPRRDRRDLGLTGYPCKG